MTRIHTNGDILVIRGEGGDHSSTHYKKYKKVWSLKRDHKLEELRELFDKKLIYLIGKGKSLDSIKAFSFNTPIICLNESIIAIERLKLSNPVFLLQHDNILKTIKTKYPVICSEQVRHLYPDPYVYQPERWNLLQNEQSAVYAIRIAAHLGAKCVVLKAFDMIKSGDNTYAKSIGHIQSAPDMLEAQRSHIMAMSKDISLVFE